jgi:hypothetical protein
LRSTGAVAACVVLAGVLAASGPATCLAQGNEAVGRTSVTGGGIQYTAFGQPTGFQAGLASGLYPGLGQLLNGKETKSLIIGAIESYLIARLILEDRRTRYNYHLYEETGDEKYFEQYSKHFDSRQNILWWTVVAAIYGIADAYVDAHLAGFDESASPRLEGELAGGPDGMADGLKLAVVVRF